MAKTRILIKRRAFAKSISLKKTPKIKISKIRPGMGVDLYDPTAALLDEEQIGRAIWECLKNGNSEGVIEIIKIHLGAYNKTQLAKNAKIPKTTLYHTLRSKNPTIKTLAKLVHGCIE